MPSAVFCNALYFMLILLVPIFAIAQPYRNVSLGSSLIANNASSTWLSQSGDFAFGFQKNTRGGGYLLAIWFDKIPEKTIIWSAKRDMPAPEGSKVQIFTDGRFQLDDPAGQLIWAADMASYGVAYGSMLDTGNLILVDNASTVLWQSFDYPTDTIVPAQILNQTDSLVSSFSETNYSSGRFKFTLNNGSPVFYTRNFPMDNNVDVYLVLITITTVFQAIFNQSSGYIFLAEKNGTVANFLFASRTSTGEYYQRVVLDYDGVLRHYIYPKSGDSAGGRPMAWSILNFMPPNICDYVKPQLGGSGACGFNSICSLGVDQRPNCVCPTGYSIIDPNDRLSGCKPNFAAQNCDPESQETSRFTFVEMPNIDFPYNDYKLFQPVGEDWCRQTCLDDCFCALAIYRGTYCWRKKYPFSNGGVVDPSLGGKALIKIRKDNATLPPPASGTGTGTGSNPRKSSRSALIIAGSVLLSSLVLLNIFTAFMLFAFRLKAREEKMLQPNTTLTGVNVKSFTFKELEEATNGFEEELGRGACSTVYKGTLKNESSGPLIAVKKLNQLAKDVEKEFKAEVNSIGKTNHKNLVQLLGYCDEGENKLLVYEYMSNGSMASFLFKNSRPSWNQRVKIAFATARGICYLHEGCITQIIHCDIKPQNVLLDDSFTAKISDFGLAKLLRPDQTRTTTGIRGTRGYVAPEWFRDLPITVKADVYSFGILLLELICCRRKLETCKTNENENEVILAHLAYDCYMEGKLRLLVADDEEALDDIDRFVKFIMIAIWCIQGSPSLRPNMKRVLQMLEGSVHVPPPPDLESSIN